MFSGRYQRNVGLVFWLAAIFLLFLSLRCLQGELDEAYVQSQWDVNRVSQHPNRIKSIIPSKYHSLMGELYWLKLIEFTYSKQFSSHDPVENIWRLFNIVTTLEPHVLFAYGYTLFIYATMDPSAYPKLSQHKLEILDKGIETFKDNWWFYREQALVYKLEYQNNKKAAEVLYTASCLPNAPAMLNELAFDYALDAQNDVLLDKILINMDKKTKTPQEQAFYNLNRAWLDSVLDRARFRKMVAEYKQNHHHYPVANWQRLTSKMVMGLPLFGGSDPAGHPYQLNEKTGEIELDPASPFHALDLLYKNKQASKQHERH